VAEAQISVPVKLARQELEGGPVVHYTTIPVEAWQPVHVKDFIRGIDARLGGVAEVCFERDIGGKTLLTLPRDELARILSINPLMAARILAELSRLSAHAASCVALLPEERSLESVLHELEYMGTRLEQVRPLVEQALGSATSDVALDALLAVQTQSAQLALQAATLIKSRSPVPVGDRSFRSTPA
jgi:hypothetical protein